MSKRGHGDTVKFVVGNIVIPLLCVLITHVLTKTAAQEAIVNSLASVYDYVDSDMTYEQALQSVYKKSKSDDEKIAALNQQIIELQRQNSEVSDSDREKVTHNSQINLLETNVLYDGLCYKLYLPSEGDSFSMGSKTYNNGFVMYDDHSLFGEGDGYTLFDLGGEYSKISFYVGRTNEYEKQDVTLKVYLNGEYIEEYSLNAQSPPIYLEIDLTYANNLKLEITGGSRVKYGFADVILYY